MMEWLFDICCKIMSSLGDFVGLSYKEICVIGNIHIQGGIWLLSALLPIIAMIWTLWKQTSFGKLLYLIFAIGYGLGCSILLMMFVERYSFPITEGFDICVNDLRFIAKAYNTTYQAINILIFVIAWLLSVGWNIMTTKLILKNRITLSFLTMIASSLLLLSFIFIVVSFFFGQMNGSIYENI